MRPLFFAFCFLLAGAAGCGGGGSAARRPRLVEGEGVYVLRYNPPRCVSSPDLFFEVETPLGWERVALESADEELDQAGTLSAEGAVRSEAMVRVRGVLLDEARPFGANHAARILRVQVVDPPLEAPSSSAHGGG